MRSADNKEQMSNKVKWPTGDPAQEQSSNTPEYWGKLIADWLSSAPKPTRKTIERSVQGWVVDIREDEINAIIKEIEKRQRSGALSAADVIALLKKRLPVRP